MAKAKYMVTSGFLGAGKTTSMIAFARSVDRRWGRAAILANDLGARDIVDADYTAASSGVLTDRITGDCICYQHENLVDKLNRLAGQGADVIFSDIPGCGIGALDHVYLELERREPDEFTLMPFLCVVDPERLRMLMPERADLGFPGELRFLLDAQLAEADLIVLNKIDLLTPEEREQRMEFLTASYPGARVMAISALTGEGVDQAVDYLMTHTFAAVHREIGYGSDAFVAAERHFSWYNRRVFFEQTGQRDIDFNTVAEDLLETVRRGLKAAGGNVPHLKLFAAGEGSDFVKASLLGVDCPLEFARRLDRDYTAVSFIINARATADSQLMAAVADDAVRTVEAKHGLRSRTFFMEAFGMMEEGRSGGGRASRCD